MELPQTLHAQLYLFGYDRKRHQFRFHRDNGKDTHWLFGFALRAAMLTDLYLTGYLEDKDGKAYPASAARHDDPVLHEALKGAAGRDWAQLIADGEHHAPQVVRNQLEATGWVRGSSTGCSASSPPPASGSMTKTWSAAWPTR